MANTTPSTTPASPSATPAPVYVKRWSYPFPAQVQPQKGKDQSSPSKAPTDARTYYKALSQAQDGFYPIGANDLWHGGIHFDDGTGSALLQEAGVRCMADGEVLAYRIDDKYPKVEYKDNKVAFYSTGFVLVRHRLRAPAKPKPTSSSSPASTPPAGSAKPPEMVFYSLYMHLLDWDGYRAMSLGKGWVGDLLTSKPLPIADPLPRPAFWVDADKNKRRVGKKANETDSRHWFEGKGEGVIRRDSRYLGTWIGWLPPGSEVTLTADAAVEGYRKIASVDQGLMIPSTYPKNVADASAPNGWVYEKDLDPADREPAIQSRGKVYVLDHPAPINAGDLIGYLGEYQRYIDQKTQDAGMSRKMVHVEMFAGEDLPDFIDQCRTWAKGFSEESKTLLCVDEGLVLSQPSKSNLSVGADETVHVTADSPVQGPWVKVQKLVFTKPTPDHPDPPDHADGDAFWVERGKLTGQHGGKGPLDGWKQFPLQAGNTDGPTAAWPCVTPTQGLPMAQESEKKPRWWLVEVGTEEGKSAMGWVCETGSMRSPWEWPGFEREKEELEPVDLHGKRLHDNGLSTTDAQKAETQKQAERVKAGRLFQKLYALLDVNKDDKLSGQELKNALQSKWEAPVLGRLSVRYQSEWGGPMDRWDELDKNMGADLEDWKKEKERIKTLWWWYAVEGEQGFPSYSKVYHLHPIGMVGNFFRECDCINYDAIFVRQPAPAYRDDQIVNWSHYRLPVDTAPGRIAGNTRRGGDASKEVQIKAIDFLVQKGRQYHLIREDIAMVLAMARVESGFNPDAAAGTTSASGLGQFTDPTATAYGITTDNQRFDAEQGADALVRHYLTNKRYAIAHGATGRDVFVMIYAYHHDGPALASGGRELSESKVMPMFDFILNNICDDVAE